MPPPDGFLYAGARLQARYGPRTFPAAWRRLSGRSDAPGWLAGLGATDMRPYLAGLDPGAGAHALEQELCRRYRREVAAVTRWVPTRWRPTMSWTRHLPDLALLAAIARGDGLPDWATEDPRVPRPGGDPAAAGESGSGAAQLLARIAAGGAPLEAWTDLWRARWPRGTARRATALPALAQYVTGTLGAETMAAADAADPPARWLERSFRRHTRDPAGAAAYLLLRWLDTRRVRAGLAQRVLAGGTGNGNAGP